MPFGYAHLQYFRDYAGKRQSSSVRIIAIVTSIAVSVVLLTMVYCFRRRKLKRKYKVKEEDGNYKHFIDFNKCDILSWLYVLLL